MLDAGLAEFVDLDYRVSPEIRLTPTTGHTPGHVSVMIESEGERAVITGDMVHHPSQLAHLDWAAVRAYAAQVIDVVVQMRREAGRRYISKILFQGEEV